MSSYTTVKIDGQTHKFLPNTQHPTSDYSKNINTSEFTIESINIKQIISITNNLSTNREDAIEIKYIVTNNDTVSHNAGIRIMIDTLLGYNDGVPFRVPGFGSVKSELQLSKDDIPEYWQAFDNLINPTIITQGTLLNSSINRPDKLLFTRWNKAFLNEWDLIVDPDLSITNDSAICIYWDEKPLLPGESREYISLYGLSEFTKDLTPPLAVSISGASKLLVTDLGYSPNPFNITSYIMNNGNGEAHNVKAKLRLPDNLSLTTEFTEKNLGNIKPYEEKQVSWNINVTPSLVDRHINYLVEITSDNSGTKVLSKSVFIPSFVNDQKETIILIPGISGTTMSIDHIEEGSSISQTHSVWKPRLWHIGHDIDLLACNDTGYSVNDLIIDSPLDEYYGKLLKSLNNNGFNAVYFGYDWRMDNEVTARNLDAFINSLSSEKVSIVAHSMGGLVSLKYIDLFGSDKINKLITIGTPYLGAPKALYTFETGKLLNDIRDLFINKHLKSISPNISSMYQLLPSKNYFNYNDTYYIEKKIDNGWFRKDIIETLTSFNITNQLLKSRNWLNNLLYNNSLSFHSDLDLIHLLKSVDSYFIIGDSNSTIGKVRELYKAHEGELTFDKCDDIKNINGDGTVPLISANIGNKTELIHPNHTYYIDEEHSSLPSNTNVITQVVNILNGINELVNEVRREYNQPRTMKLIIECPVDLHVYDSLGNHMGKTNEFEYEENISGGSYYIIDDKKITFLIESDYMVELIGTDNGKMTYTIERYDENNNIVEIIRFDNVKITPTTIIKSALSINNEISLRVDENSDEIIDRIINPSVILDQQSSYDITPPSVEIISNDLSGSSWYNSDVELEIKSIDDNSGVNRIEYIINTSNVNVYDNIITLTNEGLNDIYAVAYDNNRNKSDAVHTEVRIDKTSPVIDIYSKIDGKEFILNEKVILNYNIYDSLSGIDFISSTLENGDYIDTTSVGLKTITINSKDVAGNETTKIITYHVKYMYSDLLNPVDIVKNNTFTLGSTIPIKFKLRDIEGNQIDNCNGKLYLSKIDNNVYGEEIEGISSSNVGNNFRYDIKESNYIFNLKTKDLSPGTWELRIKLDDGSISKYKITLIDKNSK